MHYKLCYTLTIYYKLHTRFYSLCTILYTALIIHYMLYILYAVHGGGGHRRGDLSQVPLRHQDAQITNGSYNKLIILCLSLTVYICMFVIHLLFIYWHNMMIIFTHHNSDPYPCITLGVARSTRAVGAAEAFSL